MKKNKRKFIVFIIIIIISWCISFFILTNNKKWNIVIDKSLENYMSFIPDNTLISNMTILETHNSLANNIYTIMSWVEIGRNRNQDFNIKQQLEMWVRNFDLEFGWKVVDEYTVLKLDWSKISISQAFKDINNRYKSSKLPENADIYAIKDDYYCVHWLTAVSTDEIKKCNLEMIFDIFIEFLDTHPKEVIFVDMSKANGIKITDEWNKKIQDYLKTLEQKWYFPKANSLDSKTTLWEIRWKIVVLPNNANFNSTLSSAILNSWVQVPWKNLEFFAYWWAWNKDWLNKFEKFSKPILDKALADNTKENRFYRTNYNTSGDKNFSYRDYSWWLDNWKDYIKWQNVFLSEYLDENYDKNKVQTLGVIQVDFVTPELAKKILRFNNIGKE